MTGGRWSVVPLSSGKLGTGESLGTSRGVVLLPIRLSRGSDRTPGGLGATRVDSPTKRPLSVQTALLKGIASTSGRYRIRYIRAPPAEENREEFEPRMFSSTDSNRRRRSQRQYGPLDQLGGPVSFRASIEAFARLGRWQKSRKLGTGWGWIAGVMGRFPLGISESSGRRPPRPQLLRWGEARVYDFGHPGEFDSSPE